MHDMIRQGGKARFFHSPYFQVAEDADKFQPVYIVPEQGIWL